MSAMIHAHAELIQEVIRQIDLYRGEPIVKGQHPLWLAVVALEKASRKCGKDPRGQTVYKLDRPAPSLWYYCLWASRDKHPNIQRGMRAPPGCTREQPPDPALALHWAGRLRETLVGFLQRAEELGANPT